MYKKDKSEVDEIRRKRREDKIFNNGYKSGEGMKEKNEYKHQASISIHADYADAYLNDIYKCEDSIDYNIGLDKIFKFISEDGELKRLLTVPSETCKIKLSKDEINLCFTKILNLMEKSDDAKQFYNPIYILEALSSILFINSTDPIKDYKKIFDSLSVEIQEELLVELNKKYNFLEGKMNKKKIH